MAAPTNDGLPMFKQLKTKLTFAYGSLLGLILISIAMAVYVSVENTAKTKIADEMEAASAVYAKLWSLKSEQLKHSTGALARDSGFREAAASHDVATLASALESTSRRVSVDISGLITVDGKLILAGSAEEREAPVEIWKALTRDGSERGIIEIGGVPHQVVSEPVRTPGLIGWVLFGSALDAAMMKELEGLSSIPLTAKVVMEDDLSNGHGTEKDVVVRDTRIGGFGELTDAHLILSYPIVAAMAPFRTTLFAVIVVTVCGVVALLVCSWFISRSVTRPISTLDNATRALADGRRMPINVSSTDEIGRLAASFSKMADEIELREENILRLSLTDTETELPNRRALQQKLDDICGQGHANVYAAVISPARFARIMAVIGQNASNRLMATLGKRIADLCQVQGIGRLGSDLLGLIITADSDSDAFRRLQDIVRTVSDSIEIDGEKVDIQLDAGFAPFAADERLGSIDRAVIALQQGRGRHVDLFQFDVEAYGDPSGTLSLMSEMIDGLKDGSIYMTYQPKVDLRRQTIGSVEALLRWKHPVRGFVSPEEFVRTAEETGHIRPLSEWVLKQVRADRQSFVEAGFDIKMAVNLSGRLLTDSDFLDWSIATIRDETSRYCFEVTETAVIDDPELALANIERLRDAGIEISIDDYGSGLSSLSYLKQIPAHELKIDKSFVIPLAAGSSDALLIKSTIDLAHSLGMTVTAEGVESAEVLAILSGMGADSAQGFFISRPVKHDEAITFLRDFVHHAGTAGTTLKVG